MNKISFLNSLKPLLKSIMIIATLATMFTACSQYDELPPSNPSLAVQFTAGNIAAVQTRTTIENISGKTQWEQGDAVGIFMSGDAGNYEYTISDATTGTLSADAANTLYYPQDGTNVYFIAYYPYNSSQTLGNYAIDIATQTNSAGIDLLYAKTTPEYNRLSKTVNLEFSHVLAKLKMKIMKGLGFSDMTGLTAVELQNVSTTAGFDLSDGATFSNRVQGNIVPRITSVKPDIQYEALLIPGKYTSGTIKFTVDGNDYFWNISGINFESGKLYDYEITVNKDKLTITGPKNGTTWGNGGSETITGT